MNHKALVIVLVAGLGLACGRTETPGPPPPTTMAPGQTPSVTLTPVPGPVVTPSSKCDELTEFAAPGSFQCVARHSRDRAEVPCSANPCRAGS